MSPEGWMRTIRSMSGNRTRPLQLTDDEIRDWWRDNGGSFNGPNVEQAAMPEDKLLKLMRQLLTLALDQGTKR